MPNAFGATHVAGPTKPSSCESKTISRSPTARCAHRPRTSRTHSRCWPAAPSELLTRVISGDVQAQAQLQMATGSVRRQLPRRAAAAPPTTVAVASIDAVPASAAGNSVAVSTIDATPTSATNAGVTAFAAGNGLCQQIRKLGGTQCAGLTNCRKYGMHRCWLTSALNYREAAPLRAGGRYCLHHEPDAEACGRVQCEGDARRTGARCRVTSAMSYAEAEPLRNGDRFCSNHNARALERQEQRRALFASRQRRPRSVRVAQALPAAAAPADPMFAPLPDTYVPWGTGMDWGGMDPMELDELLDTVDDE